MNLLVALLLAQLSQPHPPVQGPGGRVDKVTCTAGCTQTGRTLDINAAGGGGAPTDADYVVGTANAGLSAERVGTDTSTVDFDLGTAGQAKWNVLNSPALSADPGDCSTPNFARGINAAGTAQCAQPAYSEISGTPTLRYQTVEDEGTPQIQRSVINFTGGGITCTDDGAETDCDVPANPSVPPDVSGEAIVTIGASAPLTNEKVVPTCAANNVLTYSGGANLVCVPDAGGGSGGNYTEVSVDLGDTKGLIFTTTVTGLAWVTANSRVLCNPQATTADGQTIETYFASAMHATVSNLVASTGFDLTVFSPHGATGTFRFACTGL